MKAFKLNYGLKNGSTLSVGIIADNREEAVKTLMDKQKNVRTISQIEIGMDIHA